MSDFLSGSLVSPVASEFNLSSSLCLSVPRNISCLPIGHSVLYFPSSSLLNQSEYNRTHFHTVWSDVLEQVTLLVSSGYTVFHNKEAMVEVFVWSCGNMNEKWCGMLQCPAVTRCPAGIWMRHWSSTSDLLQQESSTLPIHSFHKQHH